MNCKTAKRMISAFLDGELSETKARLLSEHVDSCAVCRGELMATRNVNNALGLWPGIAPTFSLADVKQRAAERRARQSHIWTLPHLGQMPRWATGLAAVFAILIGTVGGVGLEAIRQPIHQTATASAAVSDILSLGGSGIGKSVDRADSSSKRSESGG